MIRTKTHTSIPIWSATGEKEMGYFLRVRLASFFAGAATASAVGLLVLYRDYKVAQESISQQMKGLFESLDGRILSLEKLKEAEAPQHVETTE
ncbi:uncharacterized protein LOC122664676 [Telopea speciosissima]|uniref:uncharacterized protein LOC122664676 n=1 Tax=Telopea speciosissima TaxID=54955 RepID=UPI001CC75803|nr:uncharacterized protein LOC122664676 [Telopea speciosissima]